MVGDVREEEELESSKGGGGGMRNASFVMTFSPLSNKLSKTRIKKYKLFAILTEIKLYRQSRESSHHRHFSLF